MTPKIEVRLSPSNTTPNISLHIVVLCPCSCELKVFFFSPFFFLSLFVTLDRCVEFVLCGDGYEAFLAMKKISVSLMPKPYAT